MRIIEYDKKYKEEFIKYNKAWIIDNFGFLEAEDIETFQNLENYINRGSMIYFAIEEDIFLAGCMVKKEGEEWEICKLCSNNNVNHKGAGSLVFKECLDYALRNGAKRVYIITNDKLLPALHIYRKYGFKEKKLENYHYKRGNLAFEYIV